MTTLLIANVGNRDVWVDKCAPLAPEIHPQHNKEASRRALGTALLADWARCRPFLSLAILGKAIAHVRSAAGKVDRVVLIASDQARREGVAQHYLEQDTCTLAPIVARLLNEQFGVPDDSIEHWTVEDNPADYTEMQRFFRERLPALRRELPEAVAFLEVSGGTPAMTSMLLTVGVEVFGLDAYPFYVSEHALQAFPLEIGRRLVADALLDTVRGDLEIFAYHAAAQTVRQQRDLLAGYAPVDVLLPLLEYALQRQNFDFDTAWSTLRQMRKSNWREQAIALSAGLDCHDPAWVLAEGIYSAELALRLSRLLEFVARVFQFVEGVLRMEALSRGVEFVNQKGQPCDDGNQIAPQWMESHADVVQALSAVGVRFDKGANRFVLSRVVQRLCEQAGDAQGLQTLDDLKRLEKIGDLRNRAVHSAQGLSLKTLKAAFFGEGREARKRPDSDVQEIVCTMQGVWSRLTGRPFEGANPYDRINCLIREALAA
jgi:hypothetical protein